MHSYNGDDVAVMINHHVIQDYDCEPTKRKWWRLWEDNGICAIFRIQTKYSIFTIEVKKESESYNLITGIEDSAESPFDIDLSSLDENEI